MHKEIASRILSTNQEKWNTIPRTYYEIDTLRNKFKEDKEKLKALEDINSYIEEMEKIYHKALHAELACKGFNLTSEYIIKNVKKILK